MQKYVQAKRLSRIPRLARQDLAAGFVGALPGLRLAPHIVKHTRGATQTSVHVENHTTHTHTKGKTTVPMGVLPSIGTFVGASKASAHPLCVCSVVCGFLRERSFVWRACA